MMEVDSGAQLLTTLLLMFFGALLAGSLPFFIRVRENHLQTVAALGGGLLIGSALAVIIPEGFHAFAKASSHDNHHHQHGAEHDHGHDHGHEHAEEGLPEGAAGLVLVGGFLFMLLLDHLQHAAGGSHGGHHHHGHGHGHSHSHGHSHGHGTSCSSSHERLKDAAGAAAGGKAGSQGAAGAAKSPAASMSRAASGGGEQAQAAVAPAAVGECSGDVTGKSKEGAAGGGAADPQSAITGLVIHCAADGLAMGAAFLSGDARLSMLVAVAMVLHKVPMAFGLSTYLMACHWPWQRAQRTLVVFSAAAPAATLATYTLLGSLTVLSSPGAVALCVIFSGGTFLYAATMHILPEVLGGSGHMSSMQLAAVSLGCLLPVLLSWGHEH